MLKSPKNLIAGLLVAATLAFSVNATAQVDGVTIPRAAIAVNENGAYAGLFDELIKTLAADQAYDRQQSIINTLGKKGPFTVFAPTDGAFQALKQTLACNGIAMSDIPDLVRTVLAYHAAAGEVFAADALGATVTTLAGADLSISESGVITDVAGQSINIIITDLDVDNGVIHVIDGVLLPADLGLSACGG